MSSKRGADIKDVRALTEDSTELATENEEDKRFTKQPSDLVETDGGSSPLRDNTRDSNRDSNDSTKKINGLALTKMNSNNDEESKKSLKIEVKELMVPVNPDWTMFIKQQVLGQGAYGVVYKVKSLKTSILTGGSEGARVVLNSPTVRMKRKLNKNMLGMNMQSTIEKANRVRSIIVDQQYVVKEIDTALLPKEAAFEAL